MSYYTRSRARSEFSIEAPKRKELYTNDLSFWPALLRFERDFLEKVEHFFVCSYHDVFVRTRDDCIFAVGKNKSGSLGLGLSGEDVVTEPREVVELRKQRVVQILCIKDNRFHFHLAVTEQGRLFSWGPNVYGMLGLDKSDNGFVATRPRFVMDKVRFVRSGVIHLAALDTSGNVWRWGASLEDKKMNNCNKPNKLTSLQQVVDLECSIDITVALTANHEIFCWYTFGPYQLQPTRVNFSFPYKVVSLAAFYHASFLMLTSTGQVFHCFNDLSNGQRSPAIICNLVKLSEPISCIISTYTHRSLTLLVTRTDRILSISETKDKPVAKPSSLTALADVLALYGHYVTPNLVAIGPTARVNHIELLFNNPRTADLHLHNLNLYIHQQSLTQKQPYFGQLVNLSKIKRLVMRWTFFSYVHYLYCSRLIDGNELAFSLFTLTYIVNDVKLLSSIVKHITIEMCHLYLLHQAEFIQYLECHLSRAIRYNRMALDSMLTTKAQTKLDASLQARIVRWMIQRAIHQPDSVLPRVNAKHLFETPPQQYSFNENGDFNSQLSFSLSSQSSIPMGSSIIDYDDTSDLLRVPVNSSSSFAQRMIFDELDEGSSDDEPSNEDNLEDNENCNIM